MSKTKEVVLTKYESYVAGIVGVSRLVNSYDLDKTSKFVHGWDVDIEAACAEMVVAKYFGIYWDGSVNTWKRPDVGSIQVRYTHYEDGSLIVRPPDSDDENFVLVTGKTPRYFIRGWIRGKDAKDSRFWRNKSGKIVGAAWFVPQDALHHIGDLNLQESQQGPQQTNLF